MTDHLETRVAVQEALRMMAECANSKKMSFEILDQPEIMRYLLISLSFCPNMMEMVLDAVLTRFRLSIQFAQTWFESCTEILCLLADGKAPIGYKGDVVGNFLEHEKVIFYLPNIKHKAFDMIEKYVK